MSVNSVYARGWVPHTCIAMSSSIRITSMDAASNQKRQIGLIQNFKPTDDRKMERARGVGYGDRVAEIIPAMTDTKITCSRICLYEANILQVFGYHTRYGQVNNQGSVRSLSHMKNPFDIEEIIWYHAPGSTTSGGMGAGLGADQTRHTVTVYHDCWFQSWARNIDIKGDLMLMEDVNIEVTWVSDGVEPDSYEIEGPSGTTDVWGTHGLGCQSTSVKMGVDQNFATGGYYWPRNPENPTFAPAATATV